MKCNHCQTELSPGASFCGECGQPVAAVPAGYAACTHCGAPLSPGAQFCGECGQPAPGAPVGDAAPGSQRGQPVAAAPATYTAPPAQRGQPVQTAPVGYGAQPAQRGSRAPIWPVILVAAIAALLGVALFVVVLGGNRLQQGLGNVARRSGSSATSQPAVTVVTPVPPATPMIIVVTAERDTRPVTDHLAATNTSLPTETPLPTVTSQPTSTSLPTLTPLPTYTPLPTHTPLPTYTPLPTDTPPPPPTDAPTKAPTQPPPKPTATRAPPPPQTTCPGWYSPPEPGKGILVIENHIYEELQAEHIRGGSGQWVLPAKQGETPGRLLLQLAPGDQEILVHTASGGRGHIVLRMEEAMQLVSPVWFNNRYDEFVYGLTIPEGCQ